jgi:hypothetical protein
VKKKRSTKQGVDSRGAHLSEASEEVPQKKGKRIRES